MENGNNHEQPQESLQELNAQLNRFFEFIPVYDLEEKKEEWALARLKNEPKEKIQYEYSDENFPEPDFNLVYRRKLKALLEKAVITPEFRDMIVSHLDVGRYSGIPQQVYDYRIQNDYYFLDFDQNSGGIFDKNKAVNIERKAIARETVKLTNSQEYLERLLNDPIIDKEKEEKISRQKEIIERQKETLNNWIQNFKDIYGEDIIS